MTVKQLIEILNESIAPDEKCRNLVVRISDTLAAFSDIADITEIGYKSSIETFVKNGKFNISRSDPVQRDIAKELECILSEMQTWVKSAGKEGRVYQIEAKRQSQLRRISAICSAAFTVVSGAIGLAFIILTVLSIKTGADRYQDLPEIIGCAGVVIGIVSFIYERISDTQKNKLSSKADLSLLNNKENEFIAEQKIEIQKYEDKSQRGFCNFQREENTYHLNNKDE